MFFLSKTGYCIRGVSLHSPAFGDMFNIKYGNKVYVRHFLINVNVLFKATSMEPHVGASPLGFSQQITPVFCMPVV